jgi:hypothetical protein
VLAEQREIVDVALVVGAPGIGARARVERGGGLAERLEARRALGAGEERPQIAEPESTKGGHERGSSHVGAARRVTERQ